MGGESRRRKTGRPRAGEEALTRERILSAALRLVDEEGMGALSMRRLAAELGVDPMAIYHHLSGKKTIVSGLVEVVFSEMRLPPLEGLAWQERVRAWAAAYGGLTRSHPNLVLELVSDAAAVSDAMLWISEPLYAALEEAGLSPRGIALSADSVVDFVHGSALTEDAASSEGLDVERELLARIEAQPAERSPTMRRVFRALAEDEPRSDSSASGFDCGLDILLKGIEAIADNASGQQRTK